MAGPQASGSGTGASGGTSTAGAGSRSPPLSSIDFDELIASSSTRRITEAFDENRLAGLAPDSPASANGGLGSSAGSSTPGASPKLRGSPGKMPRHTGSGAAQAQAGGIGGSPTTMGRRQHGFSGSSPMLDAVAGVGSSSRHARLNSGEGRNGSVGSRGSPSSTDEPTAQGFGGLPAFHSLGKQTSRGKSIDSGSSSPPLSQGSPNLLGASFESRPSASAMQRRSMLRQGGTASHPDLATLVRHAKKKSSDRSGASPKEGEAAGPTGGPHGEALETLTDYPVSDALGTGSTERSPRGRRATESSSSSSSPRQDRHGLASRPDGHKTPQNTIGRAGGSDGRSPASLATPSSTASYVHIGRASVQGLDQEVARQDRGRGPANPLAGVGMGQAGSRDDSRSTRSTRKSTVADDTSESAWGSTMRKTSGFFRRRFGSAAGKSESSHLGIGQPKSSMSSETSPPVPALPASYLAQAQIQAPPSPAATPDPPSSPGPKPPRRGSSTAYSDEVRNRPSSDSHRPGSSGSSPTTSMPSPFRAPRSRESSSKRTGGSPRALPLPQLNGLTETHQPAAKSSRRTGGRASPRLPQASTSQPWASTSKATGSESSAPHLRSHSTATDGSVETTGGTTTEEEVKLERDLGAWHIDGEGVLGGFESSPLANGVLAAFPRTTPRPAEAPLPGEPEPGASSHLGSSVGQRSPLSTEKALPPDPTTPTRARAVTADTMASQATADSFRPSPSEHSALENDDEATGAGSPSIRVIGSQGPPTSYTSAAGSHASTSTLPDTKELPTTNGQAHLPGRRTRARAGSASSSASGPVGLGFNLETIREGAAKDSESTVGRRPTRDHSSSPVSLTKTLPSPTVVVSAPMSSASPLAQNGRGSAKRASFNPLPSSGGPVPRRPLADRPPSRTISAASSVTFADDAEESTDRVDMERPTTPGGTPLSMEAHAKLAADKAFNEDPSFLKRDKISEWLGSGKPLNNLALQAYMDKFDLTGLRIDMAFRKLCERLYLKGETQQVDRVLEAFSRRFFEQNQSRLYQNADIVHAMCYSLVLLNTDLHVVSTTTRMTRTQFIRNTMGTVRAQTEPPPSVDMGRSASSSSAGMHTDEASLARGSTDQLTRPRVRTLRSNSIVSWKSQKGTESSPDLVESPMQEFPGAAPDAKLSRLWEAELESLLKKVYDSVKSQPIYKPSTPATSPGATTSPAGSLGEPANSPYGSWPGIQRAVSRRSQNSLQSEGGGPSKRMSLRGLGGLLTANSSDSGFRSTSPTPSTATSMTGGYSSATLGSHPYTGLTSPSIGFASSLSHSIIREQQEDEGEESDASDADEDLTLLGAPWAKEGILQRKHYWEAKGKRAKDKTWAQTFVVVQRGELKMFKFGDGTGSGPRSGGAPPGMGGGNWLSNAQSMGDLTLAHALASALPSGYNRQRPHAFVLTLSGRSSYFFQAGTGDLVAEWVSTCNYWAARLSKEPYTGGVSNMEYGWNRVRLDDDDRPLPPAADDRDDRGSIRSGFSGHSTFSRRNKLGFQHSLGQAGAAPSSNPHDRIFVADWKTPQLPATASSLGEQGQLDSLKRTASNMQGELERHNKLRKPMLALFTPRSPNYTKASHNWERKSQYLLAELVKYSTYIDALEAAIRLRVKQRDEKRVNQLLSAADDAEVDVDYEDPTPSPTVEAAQHPPAAETTSSLPPASSPTAPEKIKSVRALKTARPDSGQASVATTGTSNSQHFFEAEEEGEDDTAELG